MSGIVVNYAWSQIANPVSVSERKGGNVEGLIPNSDLRDRVFDGADGNDASVSEVLSGMMTKNGVLMQVIINTVKVSVVSSERGRSLTDFYFSLCSS